MSTKTATPAEIKAALTPIQHAMFISALGTGDKTVRCPILGDIPAMYRSDRECDVLKITRARVCLSRQQPGSPLVRVYTVQVNGIASGYPAGSI